MQRAIEHVLAGLREPHMRRAHAPPASGDRKKNFGHLCNESSLLLRRKHQVSVTLFGRSQRCEDAVAHTKIRIAHMRAFFRTRQAQRYPAEIGNFDGNLTIER